MPLYFLFNPSEPNPSHVLENATQPNQTHGWTQPMSIWYGVTRFLQEYFPDSVPPICSLPEVEGCLQDTDVPVTRCEGRRACTFSQTIVLYQQGTALCPDQRDGNFVRVEFTCVTGAYDLNSLARSSTVVGGVA